MKKGRQAQGMKGFYAGKSSRKEKRMGNRIFDREQYARTARAVAAEGVVMLRNERCCLWGKKKKSPCSAGDSSIIIRAALVPAAW